MTIGINYSQWKLEHESILKDFSQKEIFFLFSSRERLLIDHAFYGKSGRGIRLRLSGACGARFRFIAITPKKKKRLSSYCGKKGNKACVA